MLEVGAIVGGKFRIERILGQGGMGVVAIATHLQLDQQVALKVLHDEIVGDAEAVERFVREARASARLRSEHVCKVSDVGQLDTGAPYIVMELLEGSDLQGVIAHAPVSIATAIDYVLQACVAIAEAHALGIVHRDLKPGNLFLTRRLDGTPLIKVLDFGIAKSPSASEFNITRTSAIMGSPGYMSPEQLRSARDVDARSDIWALGVILYELVSGRLPFQASSITELAVKVVMDPPEPLALGVPAFATIVYRCLEKDVDRRYPTVAALAADLAALGGEPGRRTATLIAALTKGGGIGPRAAAPATGDARAATAATIDTAGGLPRPPAPAGGGPAATLDTAGSLPGPPPTSAEAAAVAGRLPPGPVRSTTLETAAAQSTGTPGTPTRPASARRRLALIVGGLVGAFALAAVAAAIAVVAVRRDRHHGPARNHAPLAGELGDAGSAAALAPAGPAAVDAGPEATANLSELGVKLRTLAASHDWYAVLQIADLDQDDPEISGIVSDAKRQYMAQQARAIDAQIKLGQCARARELADAARKALPDDTSLMARAQACKPHTAPPAPPPTIEDASQALAAGDYVKAFELADKLARKAPDDLAATRVAALAACGMKNVDKARSYAAKLHGADRRAARALCRKNNIEIDAGPGESEEPAPEDALAEAQRAASQGEWAEALSLVEAVLQRTPRHVPALVLGATAACHLKDEQKAHAMLRHIPLPRQRGPRQACAQEGVFL